MPSLTCKGGVGEGFAVPGSKSVQADAKRYYPIVSASTNSPKLAANRQCLLPNPPYPLYTRGAWLVRTSIPGTFKPTNNNLSGCCLFSKKIIKEMPKLVGISFFQTSRGCNCFPCIAISMVSGINSKCATKEVGFFSESSCP